MHREAYTYVQTMAPQRPRGLVLEIGGRNINGSIRELFAGDAYVSVDVRNGSGVDVVADGATFTPATRPSTVVCCEVLEHTPKAEAICKHAHDILLPGGMFIVTTAGMGRASHSGIDGGPLRDGEYYRNVSKNDLARWLKPFEKVTIDTNSQSHDIYATAFKEEK